MAKNQHHTPFFDALKAYTHQNKLAFHTPGHKYGAGIDVSFTDFVGNQTFKIDLCELEEVDNLHDAEHVLKESMELAAQAYGADRSFFLVNGSTCGNQAMVLSTCQPGDKILIPRNSHKSVVNALILSGATPIYLLPHLHASGIYLNITPESVAEAFKRHADIKALLVVNPTYEGICPDLQAIKNLCHSHNALLLVDEAHGAHFHFHSELPLSAVDIGADMVVQSTHKTLAGMTQTAMLHVNGNRVNPSRLRQVLQMLQSSSPNYVLMASLDVARRQMAIQGTELMQHTLNISRFARSALKASTHLECLGKEVVGQPGCFALDESKLTIDVSLLGKSGFEISALLNNTYGIQLELEMLQYVMALVTFANTQQELEKLVQAFQALQKSEVPLKPQQTHKHDPPRLPQMQMTPREAFYADSEHVTINHAVGRICAETLSPYPPGIPILVPGERIAPEAVAHLKAVHHAGGLINGLTDTSLKTLQVVS